MKNRMVACIIGLLLFISCGSNTVKNAVDLSRPSLKITVAFNPDIYKSFMFKKFYPTYAIWAEDPATGEVHTIYVTGKAARGTWMMADERPSSVPVWFGVKKREKSGPQGLMLDAVASATPSGTSMTHVWQVPDNMLKKKIKVFIEGNVSFDYNDYYRKDAKKGDPGYSDVNGQPSLVWSAVIETGPVDAEEKPVLIGHGSVLGENHEIEKDMSRITTARDIFSYIGVAYSAGAKK